MRLSDLISRKDTINEIKNVFDDVLRGNISVRKGLPEAARRIEMMPSAEPKIGEWVHHDGGYSDHYECTACGTPIVLTERWKFCPNCGAKMRGI